MPTLVSILESGRRDFLDAASELSPDEACAKPAFSAWSPLECIEHVIIMERRIQQWIADAVTASPRRDPDNETRLFTIVRNRMSKVEAPAPVRPRGRFTDLDTALGEFAEVRDRSVAIATDRGAALYALRAKHPHFGTLNGAEFVQLIDAHARRHADQIRDTCEALRTEPTPSAKGPGTAKGSMKPKKSPKSTPFKRDVPDLPAKFDAPDPDVIGRDDTEMVLEEAHLKDLELPNLKVARFHLEGCLLERVQLAGSAFGSIVWKDVRLVGCDLANVLAHRISLVRVELIDCRLTGFRANAIECQDVLVQGGEARYAQFVRGKFRNTEFDRANLGEADFQESNLAGSVLRGCELGRADLRRSNLKKTDFRQSNVEGMLVEAGDLRGAIADPVQAMVFARLLGLEID